MLSWAHPSHTPNGISIGSAVYAQLTPESPYTSQWATPFQNCPFARGLLTPSNIQFLGPAECTPQTTSRSVQPFLHSSRSCQTDHATPSSIRPHPRSLRRYGLITIIMMIIRHTTSTSTRWLFVFALCYHSNVTRAPIANPPNSAQLGERPYHSPKLHPGPCSSVGMRPRTDKHTDRKTCVTTIHFASSTTHAKRNNNNNNVCIMHIKSC